MTSALFDQLGTAVHCNTKEEFDLLAVTSALIGSYFGLLETVQDWFRVRGLSDASSRTYLAGLFASLGETARTSDTEFSTLREAHSTPGGLNEQIFRDFAGRGVIRH